MLEILSRLATRPFLAFEMLLASLFANILALATPIFVIQVLNRYVPTEMFERPKAGFSIPVAEWLRGPMREWAEALLAPGLLTDSGLTGVGAIHSVWQQLLAGHDRFQEPIWGILMFQAWRLQQTKPNRPKIAIRGQQSQ